ncbi:manganese efflux pump [Ruminococcus sp. FC2018]|uniref:manganese efflux pump MntP n=1 Tax=Ruminococcus sp. FC2018 TaxID=1410617 RepID=UPI00048FE831|nr:manganese efflux pump [Ruminococcus sp. FC2018]
MGFLETVFLGVGLSMDCFAISVTNGMCKVKRRLLTALVCGLCYGLFQGALTCIGYSAGSVFAEKISSFGSYVAFVLLALSGIKMFFDSDQSAQELSAAAVFFSAFATSLDALSVGVSLSALGTDIVMVGAVIAAVTLMLCTVGFAAGSRAGKHLGQYARYFGGTVLIILALKIPAQKLGIIG